MDAMSQQVANDIAKNLDLTHNNRRTSSERGALRSCVRAVTKARRGVAGRSPWRKWLPIRTVQEKELHKTYIKKIPELFRYFLFYLISCSKSLPFKLRGNF